MEDVGGEHVWEGKSKSANDAVALEVVHGEVRRREDLLGVCNSGGDDGLVTEGIESDGAVRDAVGGKVRLDGVGGGGGGANVGRELVIREPRCAGRGDGLHARGQAVHVGRVEVQGESGLRVVRCCASRLEDVRNGGRGVEDVGAKGAAREGQGEERLANHVEGGIGQGD